jgi:hypothetical protein
MAVFRVFMIRLWFVSNRINERRNTHRIVCVS